MGMAATTDMTHISALTSEGFISFVWTCKKLWLPGSCTYFHQDPLLETKYIAQWQEKERKHEKKHTHRTEFKCFLYLRKLASLKARCNRQ